MDPRRTAIHPVLDGFHASGQEVTPPESQIGLDFPAARIILMQEVNLLTMTEGISSWAELGNIL